jgi:glycine cleavage system H protein
MSEIPADLHYSEDHLWVRPDAATGMALVGITDYAQDSMGDVVNVALPELGQAVTSGQEFGEIESTKTINDLVSPLDGTVHARNDVLAQTPELVNADPYGQGWMLEIGVAPSTLDQQLAALMDAPAYSRQVRD